MAPDFPSHLIHMSLAEYLCLRQQMTRLRFATASHMTCAATTAAPPVPIAFSATAASLAMTVSGAKVVTLIPVATAGKHLKQNEPPQQQPSAAGFEYGHLQQGQRRAGGKRQEPCCQSCCTSRCHLVKLQQNGSTDKNTTISWKVLLWKSQQEIGSRLPGQPARVESDCSVNTQPPGDNYMGCPVNNIALSLGRSLSFSCNAGQTFNAAKR
eukprot:5661846-Amphidinium_carterae.1